MSTAECTLETTLAQLLAQRAEPSVPEDIARRIVVRTAHLPQVSNDDVVVRTPPPQVVAPKVAGRSWYRASLPFGAAIAASLVLALIVQPSGPEVQPVTPSLRSAPAALALADGAPATLPALAPAATPSAPLPVREDRVTHHRSTESVPTMLADAKPIAEPIAPAPVPSTWRSTTVDEFALKGEVEPTSVYGPVLEPETNNVRSGMPGRGASASGFAAAPARSERMP